MEDNRIIDLFLERKEAAILHTQEKYGARLRALSQGIVGDYETAEECENDTYLLAWQSIPPAEPREHYYAYLARVIRNLSLNCCRDRSRLKRSAHVAELTEEMEQCIPAPDDMQSRMEAAELGRVISDFLRLQSKERRLVFLRRYWHLDCIREIAQRFQMSEAKVKILLYRSREALRKHLIKEGYTI